MTKAEVRPQPFIVHCSKIHLKPERRRIIVRCSITAGIVQMTDETIKAPKKKAPVKAVTPVAPAQPVATETSTAAIAVATEAPAAEPA